MNAGALIKNARKAKDLTQKQLGELAGIAEPTIRRYELGKLNPKYETLQRIAAALGVPVQQLIPENPSAAFDFQDAALDELRAKLPKSYGLATGDDLESPIQIVYPDGKLSKEISQGDLWAVVQNATGYLCYELDKFR